MQSILSINQHIQNQIQDTLAKLEKEQNIKILYACESGSRAWGFASVDSDYDLRFIYTHSEEDYLRILPQREEFDLFLDNDLDLKGWDLKKVLRLILKSNATPFEWMQSPIIYKEVAGFRKELWQRSKDFFQPRSTMHHYLGLAQNAFRKGMVTEFEINIKKYFYVLRPLFAAMWVAKRGSIPPMTFGKLTVVLDDHPHIRKLVTDLWDIKKQASESDTIELIPELMDFLENQVEECYKVADGLEKESKSPATLDRFFAQQIMEA